MLDNFPEIQNTTHIETHQLFALSPLISYNSELFEIKKYYAANTDLFTVFDFQVLQGDIKIALNTPFSMILTENEALRIIKDKNPIGETIIWRAKEDFPFTVQAIVSDNPQNSSTMTLNHWPLFISRARARTRILNCPETIPSKPSMK